MDHEQSRTIYRAARRTAEKARRRHKKNKPWASPAPGTAANEENKPPNVSLVAGNREEGAELSAEKNKEACDGGGAATTAGGAVTTARLKRKPKKTKGAKKHASFAAAAAVCHSPLPPSSEKPSQFLLSPDVRPVAEEGGAAPAAGGGGVPTNRLCRMPLASTPAPAGLRGGGKRKPQTPLSARSDCFSPAPAGAVDAAAGGGASLQSSPCSPASPCSEEHEEEYEEEKDHPQGEGGGDDDDDEAAAVAASFSHLSLGGVGQTEGLACKTKEKEGKAAAKSKKKKKKEKGTITMETGSVEASVNQGSSTLEFLSKAPSRRRCQDRRQDRRRSHHGGAAAAAAAEDSEDEEEEASRKEGILSPASFLRRRPYPRHYRGMTPRHRRAAGPTKAEEGSGAEAADAVFSDGGASAYESSVWGEDDDEAEGDGGEGSDAWSADGRSSDEGDAAEERGRRKGRSGGGGGGTEDVEDEDGGGYATDASVKSGRWCKSLSEAIESVGLTPAKGSEVAGPRPAHLRYVQSYAEAWVAGESDASSFCPSSPSGSEDEADDEEGDDKKA